MKGPKPPAVNLSEAERQGLEKLVKAHSTPQQIVVRARIILTASQGLNNEQVGRGLHVGVDMVGSGASVGWLGRPSRYRTQRRGASARFAQGWQAVSAQR